MRIVKVGRCPKCKNELLRTYPADYGICTCTSAVEVALPKVAFMLNKRETVRLMRFLRKVDGVQDIKSLTLFVKLKHMGLIIAGASNVKNIKLRNLRIER
jgi:hypothetical protein